MERPEVRSRAPVQVSRDMSSAMSAVRGLRRGMGRASARSWDTHCSLHVPHSHERQPVHITHTETTKSRTAAGDSAKLRFRDLAPRCPLSVAHDAIIISNGRIRICATYTHATSVAGCTGSSIQYHYWKKWRARARSIEQTRGATGLTKCEFWCPELR